MTVCEYCGFDSDADSMIAEGASCGVNGCLILSCCHEQWIKHAKKYHKHTCGI